MRSAQSPASEASPRPRIVGFTVISGVGWVIDFAVYNVLAWHGLDLVRANLISAGVAVSFVFLCGWRYIFRDARTALPVAIAAYVAWNMVAIGAASLAIAWVARALAASGWLQDVQLLWGMRQSVALAALPPAAAKILVTPVTMYLNFVACGLIIERRLHLT
jgi:putative flippase GtrA